MIYLTGCLLGIFLIRGFMSFLSYYRNPYKLIMIFGKKGSGKTTLLTKLALKALKDGHPVYSTVEVPGCYLFDVNMVGSYVFPPESVVFIDEAGMVWDNRNFKNFRSEVRDYFKYQRQYRNTVYLFSQTFDIDKKLRDVTDGMYLCKCYCGILSVARRINRSIILTESTSESESRIADNLVFDPIFSFLAGGKPALFTWVPAYAPYFKSYNPPKLPLVSADLLDSLQVVKKNRRREQIMQFIQPLVHRLKSVKKFYENEILGIDIDCNHEYNDSKLAGRLEREHELLQILCKDFCNDFRAFPDF